MVPITHPGALAPAVQAHLDPGKPRFRRISPRRGLQERCPHLLLWWTSLRPALRPRAVGRSVVIVRRWPSAWHGCRGPFEEHHLGLPGWFCTTSFRCAGPRPTARPWHSPAPPAAARGRRQIGVELRRQALRNVPALAAVQLHSFAGSKITTASTRRQPLGAAEGQDVDPGLQVISAGVAPVATSYVAKRAPSSGRARPSSSPAR